MNEQNIEQIISALYDMVQDARGLPLGADKCIVKETRFWICWTKLLASCLLN